MAQKARKDRAKANTAALTNLHVGSLVVNGLFLLARSLLFPSRSLLLWLVLSTPAFLCQLALERTGRPAYDPATKQLRSSGEDLAAQGLTEYMWDVVWVTWAAAVLAALLGDWAWWLWAVVPAYGAYKAFGLMGAARGMMGGGMPGAGGGPDGSGAGDATGPAAGGNRKQRRAA